MASDQNVRKCGVWMTAYKAPLQAWWSDTPSLIQTHQTPTLLLFTFFFPCWYKTTSVCEHIRPGWTRRRLSQRCSPHIFQLMSNESSDIIFECMAAKLMWLSSTCKLELEDMRRCMGVFLDTAHLSLVFVLKSSSFPLFLASPFPCLWWVEETIAVNSTYAYSSCTS